MSVVGLRPRQRAPSGTCPARRAGIKRQESAPADSCFARRLGGGVATATAGAFRDVPRPQGGDQAAGIRSRGFLLRPPRSTAPAPLRARRSVAAYWEPRPRGWMSVVGLRPRSGRLQGRAPPAGRGSSGRNPLPRIPASRGDSVVGLRPRSGRLQGRAPPAGRGSSGRNPLPRIPASRGDSVVGLRPRSGRLQGRAPPAGRGSSGRNPLPRIPASRGDGAEKEGFEPSRQGFPHLTP